MSVSLERISQKQSVQNSVIDRIARKVVFSMLEHLRYGRLELEENGQSYSFGQTMGDKQFVAKVSITNQLTYRQIVFNGTIGVAEAYMQGNWTTPELISVIRIFTRNQQALGAMQSRWSRIGRSLLRVFHVMNRNTIDGPGEILRHIMI